MWFCPSVRASDNLTRNRDALATIERFKNTPAASYQQMQEMQKGIELM